MSQPENRIGESKPGKWISASVLIPAVVSALVGVGTFYFTSNSFNQTEKHEILRTKALILSGITTNDIGVSEALLEHVLQKLMTNADEFSEFKEIALELIDAEIIGAPFDAKKVDLPITTSTESISEDTLLSELVRKFEGKDRRIASEQLVSRYRTQKEQVINALVEGLVKDNSRFRYRINLYIAFTLARVEPNWAGTKEQCQEIASLKNTNDYADATFKKRVDEALENFENFNGVDRPCG